MNSTETYIKGTGKSDLKSELILENSHFKVVVSIHDRNGVFLQRGFNLHVELLKKDKGWYEWFSNHECSRWADDVDVIIDDLDALLITLRMTLLGEWKDLFALVNAALDGATVMDISERYGQPYVPNYVGTYAYCTDPGEMDLTKMSDVERRIFHLAKGDWWYHKDLDSEIMMAAKQTVIKYGEKVCREADDKELLELYANTYHTDYQWRYGLRCGDKDDDRLVSLTKL